MNVRSIKSRHALSETGPLPGTGQFGSSSRVVSRQRWTPPPDRWRLVKAKQRIAHPLDKTRSQNSRPPGPGSAC
jgi:hypothetical protein